MRDGLDIIISKAAHCLKLMRGFCLEFKDMPTLGYTHMQPAQLTTVGKRGSLWMQDILTDLRSFQRGIPDKQSCISKCITPLIISNSKKRYEI